MINIIIIKWSEHEAQECSSNLAPHAYMGDLCETTTHSMWSSQQVLCYAANGKWTWFINIWDVMRFCLARAFFFCTHFPSFLSFVAPPEANELNMRACVRMYGGVQSCAAYIRSYTFRFWLFSSMRIGWAIWHNVSMNFINEEGGGHISIFICLSRAYEYLLNRR